MNRAVGQTRDVGYEIGVSRTVPHPPASVWQFLTSPAGLAIWLGAGAELSTTKGTKYQTADGTIGEVRSFSHLDRLRLTWRPPDWSHDTTLQVAIVGGGNRTSIRFHQERLADAEERAGQRAHWQAVSAKVAEVMAGMA